MRCLTCLPYDFMHFINMYVYLFLKYTYHVYQYIGLVSQMFSFILSSGTENQQINGNQSLVVIAF